MAKAARDMIASQPARRSLLPMVLVFLCSLAPIVAAAVIYMHPRWWPRDASNYGELVTPQRPMPAPEALRLTTLDGKPFDLRHLKGKWLLVTADGAACPESCARKLYIIRNTHASQGKNVDRLARVWFITDGAPVPDKVLNAYRGTVMLRVDPDQLARYLPARASAASQSGLREPIWVIDPLGNLMMRYPAGADGVKVRQDIGKLVYHSRIG